MGRLLPVLAASLNFVAFVLYLKQAYSGESAPNPASWGIWAFTSTINVFSFTYASGNWRRATQFFVGAVMCVVVFVYSLWAGRFAPLDKLGYIVLVLSFGACLVWYLSRAAYASVVIAAILLISGAPTVFGVWQNSHIEKSLPWFIWMAAFSATLVNIIRDWETIKKKEPYPWTLTAVPVSGIFLHGLVAILSKAC